MAAKSITPKQATQIRILSNVQRDIIPNLPQIGFSFVTSVLKPWLAPTRIAYGGPVGDAFSAAMQNTLGRVYGGISRASPLVSAASMAYQGSKYTADVLTRQGMGNVMTGSGWFQMPKPEQNWRYMSAYR